MTLSQIITILIIEDNEDNLIIAREILSRAGYRVLVARDGDAGLGLACNHRPDLILMDMYLPGKDGYETTRLLKSEMITQDITVVAFTALAMAADRQRAKAAGCAGVIIKPIDVDTFAQTVASYLDPKTTFRREMNQPEPMTALAEFRDQLRLSHDLQAPLRKIQQSCEFMRQSALQDMSEENRRLLGIIERSSHQMLAVLSKHFHLPQ